jgi:hypothetical protein
LQRRRRTRREMMTMMITTGHIIAQAFCHWLPSVVAWVQSQVRSCGIYGGQSCSGIGFQGEFTGDNTLLIQFFAFNFPMSFIFSKCLSFPLASPTSIKFTTFIILSSSLSSSL